MNIGLQAARAAIVTLCAVSVVGPALAHEKETTVRWGPIELPPATADGPGQVHNHVAGLSGVRAWLVDGITGADDFEVEKPCEDCYIVGIRPNMVLENGEDANFNNGTMLHHAVTLNFSRPDVTCRPSIFSSDPITALGGLAGGNQRIFAAGNERTGGRMSEGYGYYLAEGDQLGLIYHLMNSSPRKKAVYLEYTFEWVDASRHDLKRVRPIWMDVDQCGDSEIDVASGYSDVTWNWKADRTHRMTDAGGHIHNYGINVAWTNTRTDETLCNSVAGYAEGSAYAPIGPGTGENAAHPESTNTVHSDPLGLANYQGNIADMTVCNRGGGKPGVRRGDRMRLNAQIYRPDTTDHDMAIMVGYMDEAFCITDFWCY